MSDLNYETIKNAVVTSSEVIQILGISRARLSQLVRTDKLIPIKKSMFLLQEVNKRKELQVELRNKYYKTKK